ncbi:MAG: hypothetical protein LRY54_02550 [Alphaproteobacteria bacterium]|nr:hypothetical protein [Alphaproteobacteria bacterium]
MSVVRETAESLLTAIPPLNIAVRGMKMDQENARLPHDFSNQNDEDKGLLQQVLEKGYVVLPSYFDAGWCEACRNAVDTVIEKHPDYVRVREDERLFGSQNINKQLKEFHDDPRLKKLADAYVGEEAVVGVSNGQPVGDACRGRLWDRGETGTATA